MALKRIFAAALVAALLCIAGIPLFAAAVNSPEAPGNGTVEAGPQDVMPGPILTAAPAFTAELRLTHEGWGVYGTLSEITEDMTGIVPCYSFDGVEFISEDYNAWQLDPDYLQQQCFWPMESPLLEYLAEEVDCFNVKLEITYKDGSVGFTEVVTME